MASVDIILPAFNPHSGWEDLVIRQFISLREAMPAIDLQLTIVDDGSTKINTHSALEKLNSQIPNFRWIHYPDNHGKGYALRMGVQNSAADLIVYTDIDWPYTLTSIQTLIEKLLTGPAAVIGVRNEDYYQKLPRLRSLMSRFLRIANKHILQLKVNDTQAGLKGFSISVKDVFLSTRVNSYLFDLEFIYLLSKRNDIEIIPHPVELRPGIRFSKMNYNILLRETFNFIRLIFKK